MRTPWLTAVLARGQEPDPGLPWRIADAAERERELRAGTVQRVLADVVVAADADVDAVLRARALALLVPAGVVVQGEAALWVHLGGPWPDPDRTRVVIRRLPDPDACRAVPLTVSRVRPPAADLARIGPLTLTTPARSLLEVATEHPHRARRVRAALTAAGLLDDAAVAGASDRARGRAGVRTARRALSLRRNGGGTLRSSADGTP
ncbi:hypothetical protein [Kineococcus rhizosphaerae]|uniref:Transcriptional regulator with AbiEi antitoxin domain of type IV toxin-antitoxin system n=1 Tax=Kineococcus rhizosphaerae TaxID=559628 RepID=A0A2T0R9N6_9ACTN|nr:hypothetical protein [Kineococcus rhizosphaerae]PRY17879.1 hypothetical protein CLV37_101121 [Kineococcus rhizosphaerae]